MSEKSKLNNLVAEFEINQSFKEKRRDNKILKNDCENLCEILINSTTSHP